MPKMGQSRDKPPARLRSPPPRQLQRRSRLYYLAAEGKITFKRCGKRTVVLVEDLKKLLKELPDAKIPEQRGYRKRTAPPLAPPA